MTQLARRTTPLVPIVMTNLRDQVHDSLRKAVLAGRFADGERLNERVLARDLGVSTTPLKEALRQLESEGLIRTEARRGVFVTFSAQQAEEMTLARALIESVIARFAAKRATAADRENLAELVVAMEAATLSGDVERLIDLNELFHSRIHDCSGCDYLCRLQGKQQTYDHATRVALLKEEAERRRALVEHGAILRAIAGRDQDAAERLMRDHIVRSGHRHIETVFGQAPKGE